jgi:hypothetical protein
MVENENIRCRQTFSRRHLLTSVDFNGNPFMFVCSKLFVDHPVLAEHDLCHFVSHHRQYMHAGGADRLFQDYLRGDLRSLIVQWYTNRIDIVRVRLHGLFVRLYQRNNCQRESLKVIRSFYSKPYFLPASLGQTLSDNWFLISVGFDKQRTERSHRVEHHFYFICRRHHCVMFILDSWQCRLALASTNTWTDSCSTRNRTVLPIDMFIAELN